MTSDERSIAITHLDEAGGGAFVIQREDIRLAEMTYTRAGERLIIIDHQLRGLGVARKLLDALVAWARSSGTRVMATCPYAKAQFDKDPSIGDVYDGPR